MPKFRLSISLLFCAFCSVAQNVPFCKNHFINSSISNNKNTLDGLSNSSNNFDVHYYRCNWELSPGVRNIKGSVTSIFTILNTGSKVKFDLINALTIDSVKYHDANITFTRLTNSVEINFPTTILNNTKDSVTIYYQGAPPATNGYFTTTSHAGTPITWTLSESYGARYWWPCKDNLIDKADSIDIYVTHPSTSKLASNGVKISEVVNGGNTTTYWKHRYPIVSYLVAVALTNYSEQSTTVQSNGTPIPLVGYVYPESVASYNASINGLKVGFAMLEQKFGPYSFRNEQYAQTQVQNVGGMEHQTNSFISGWSNSLLVHELAHQWFGDKVTCGSWQDIWLNEGYASYSEVLNIENVSGIPARTTELNSRTSTITAQSNGSIIRADTSEASIFNYRLSYLKASYALHMLRWVLGDSKFYLATRNYLNAPGITYSFARTDSLKKYMEEAHGSSLTEFFNDWVYGEGYPTYSGRWNQNANKTFAIQLNQTTSDASVPFYEMPVPLKLVGFTEDTTVIVKHTNSGQLFNFQLSFVVKNVEFDVDRWLLAKNNAIFNDPSLIVTGVTDIVNDIYLKVGPTPASNTLGIFVNSNRQFKKLVIYNSVGSKIQEYEGTIRSIDISKLPAGAYALQLIDSNKKISMKRFIKN
jgi:aminopeptidase N